MADFNWLLIELCHQVSIYNIASGYQLSPPLIDHFGTERLINNLKSKATMHTSGNKMVKQTSDHNHGNETRQTNKERSVQLKSGTNLPRSYFTLTFFFGNYLTRNCLQWHLLLGPTWHATVLNLTFFQWFPLSEIRLLVWCFFCSIYHWHSEKEGKPGFLGIVCTVLMNEFKNCEKSWEAVWNQCRTRTNCKNVHKRLKTETLGMGA